MHAKSGLSLEEHYFQGVFPRLYERHQKFPDGESLDEVARRAERFINELVMPHLWTAVEAGKKNVHIAVVSHGICISELISALLMKGRSSLDPSRKWQGLLNTAWARITVDVEVRVRYYYTSICFIIIFERVPRTVCLPSLPKTIHPF